VESIFELRSGERQEAADPALLPEARFWPLVCVE
jgi:hypothetical protein